MKAKKVGFVVVIVFSIVAFSAMNAMAANAWFTCTVNSAAAGTTFQTKLTGTEQGGAGRTFTNKTFLLLPSVQNQMLAVLLTAMSSDMQVWVYADPDSAQFPTIYGITAVGQ